MPDRHRARTEGIQVVEVTVGRRVGDRQAPQRRIVVDAGDTRQARMVAGEAARPLLFLETVVLARIALVGGHQVGLAVDLELGDRVRHVHAEHVAPWPDVDGAIAVAGVQPLADDAMVLDAERGHVRHRQRAQVEGCHGIVLLQADPRGVAIVADRDVLRLEVLRHAGTRPEDADARRHRDTAEADRVHFRTSSDRPHFDDADRTFRIGTAVAIAVRLALVGHQQTIAAAGEHHHVRIRTDHDRSLDLAGRRQQHHGAGIGALRRGERHGDDVAVGYVHTVGTRTVGRERDAANQPRRRRVCDVDDVERDVVGVGDIHLRAPQRDRLARRYAFVDVGQTGAVGAQQSGRKAIVCRRDGGNTRKCKHERARCEACLHRLYSNSSIGESSLATLCDGFSTTPGRRRAAPPAAVTVA